MYPFPNIEHARSFARLVAEEMKAMNEQPEDISFAEAMKILCIKNNALTNRISKAGVRTFRMGRGKGFKRKYLDKLR